MIGMVGLCKTICVTFLICNQCQTSLSTDIYNFTIYFFFFNKSDAGENLHRLSFLTGFFWSRRTTFVPETFMTGGHGWLNELGSCRARVSQ